MATSITSPSLTEIIELHVTSINRRRLLLAVPATWSIWFAVAAALALIALRWSTRSTYLFDLDSILYARALDQFDLRLTQPPLPGYFLYIQLGRLVRVALTDSNLALEALSAFFGASLAAVLYVLGRDIFDRRTGMLAAFLALTGPIFWYQSDFASPRIAEGFFAVLAVWLGFRLRQRQESWSFWWLAIVAAIAGGVRQQVLLYLVPFCIWATWRTASRQRVGGALLAGAIVAAWLVPTVAAAGGLDEYRRLSADQWQMFVVGDTGVMYGRSAADVLHRLATNLGLITLYVFYTCPLGLLVAAWLARSPSRWRTAVFSASSRPLIWASVPALLFLVLIHIQQIGHAMVVAPFIALMVARMLTSQPQRRWVGLLAFAVLAVNVASVYCAPARLIGDRLGTPTLASLRQRDDLIGDALKLVHAGSPEETVVITSPLAYGFIDQYAPDYRYLVLPGLFEQPNGANLSADQRVLSNGLRPVTVEQLAEPGTVLLPATVRRFVTVGYEFDISRMLIASNPVSKPFAGAPSVAIVQTNGPTMIRFAPRQLALTPFGVRSR